MKFELPKHCGLSEKVLSAESLMPGNGDTVSVTDAQYLALQAGVSNGESLLILAPTSTGKTLVGWWAAASALEAGKRIVYLVSHRALAAQKFDEIQSLFQVDWLDNSASGIVCATGDGIIDGSGRSSSDPLSAHFLVATYEKYLAMMSAGGPPKDLTDVTFICDEIQLIGDSSRGKHVELLLTILKNSGWHQFVGLSAVMDENSAKQFAEWLNLTLVRTTVREKDLMIEVRAKDCCYVATSSPAGNTAAEKIDIRKPMVLNTIVKELVDSDESRPVIVFCMKVDDTYGFCKEWFNTISLSQEVSPPPGVEIDETLLSFARRRCSYHNAELNDDERTFVESLIADGKVDVVFATSTLAAGVNFPLGSAVFSKWKRYNFEKRSPVKIPLAEFQNMAGRVGRMGQSSSQGKVVAMAASPSEVLEVKQMIDFSEQATLGDGISPDDFASLTLQLFAGELCDTAQSAFELLSSTLSAQREAARGRGDVSHWKQHLVGQIERLISTHCMLQVGQKLTITPFGRAVAGSGLKPETVEFFINGISQQYIDLSSLLPSPESDATDDDLLFILIHASLLSPEFNMIGGPISRYLNYRIGQNGPLVNPVAAQLSDLLFERPWVANAGAANGAKLLHKWAVGESRAHLEGVIPHVRMGTLQSTARECAWLIHSVAQVIYSASSPSLADAAKHPLLRSENESHTTILQFARTMKRYAARISSGLPSDCLWLTKLELDGPRRRLSRHQMISLKEHGIAQPHFLMDGSAERDAQRQAALPKAGTVNFGNLVRNAAKKWKQEDRTYMRAKHLKHAAKNGLSDVIDALYAKKEKPLERAIQDAFISIGVGCDVLDDGANPAWPDLKLCFEELGIGPDIIVEVKSKLSDEALVPLNDVIEVLAAAQMAGHAGKPCLTICSPGAEPSVRTSIAACDSLTVTEIADLAEACLLVKDGKTSLSELYDWLATPGLALKEDLPIIGKR